MSSLQEGALQSVSAITSTSITSIDGLKDALRPHEVTVDIPASPTPKERTNLTQLRKNVDTTFSWAAKITSDLIQKKKETGGLPKENKYAESGYRAKVMSSVLEGRATWLVNVLDLEVTSPIDVPKSDFHADLLLKELRTLNPTKFGVPDFLQRTSETILKGSLDDVITAQYWLPVIYFKYNKATKEINAVLQVLNLEFNATNYMSDDVEKIKIDCNCTAKQYDFNNKRFEDVDPGSVNE